MNKKHIMLGAMGVAVLGAAVITLGASAYRGDATKVGPNYTPERHEAMEKAFENKDYAAWKSQIGERGATRKVTVENFARFAEMRKLMLEGKTAEAQTIRAELGLGQGGRGQGAGMQSGQRGQNNGGNFVDANKDGVCDRMQ